MDLVTVTRQRATRAPEPPSSRSGFSPGGFPTSQVPSLQCQLQSARPARLQELGHPKPGSRLHQAQPSAATPTTLLPTLGAEAAGALL